MEKEKNVKCPWCGKENIPITNREKSEFVDIVVRICSLCGNVLASYMDEEQKVLERVRTFDN